MLFNSFEFIIVFLPLVVVGFSIISRTVSHDMAIVWLVIASFIFYGWWNWALVFLLAASVVVNFVIGLWLARSRRMIVLVAGVVFNLGLLGWFKYADFIAVNINALAGTSIDVGNIVLPLAISFFTFQQIAYLVDVYRGLDGETGFHRYCLFVTFFPQLIAGPIVHHAEILPQFSRRAGMGVRSTDLSVGTTFFVVGLVKKLAFADPLGQHADRIFEVSTYGDTVSLVTAWYAIIAFGLQIYFDFSGYSDMAIGLARMFGIRLPLNFNSPYKAVNIIEFWRRWNMTLSRFLRDYLYFPLGGNREGPVRRHVNVMIVMLLGGLWHGASWNFILWGGLHGFYIVVNHAWRGLRKYLGLNVNDDVSLWGLMLSRGLTLLVVFFAWIPFRAKGLDAAMVMIDGALGRGGVLLPESYIGRLGDIAHLMEAWGIQFVAGMDSEIYPTSGDLGQLIAVFMIALFAPNTQEWIQGRMLSSERVPVFVRNLVAPLKWRANALTGSMVALLCFFCLVLLFRQASNAFIYFQF